MRISGNQLGTQGFMHEMSYWIMHNGFWGYALPNLQVPWEFTCPPHCTSNFWGLNLPWYAIFATNTPKASQLFNTFPWQLPNKLTGSFHFSWVTCRPSQKLWQTWRIWGTFLQLLWTRSGMTFQEPEETGMWRWAQAVLFKEPQCKYTVLPSFHLTMDWFWNCDIFWQRSLIVTLVTHFFLHRMS